MRSKLVFAALAGCVLAAVSGLGTGANAATVNLTVESTVRCGHRVLPLERST